MARRKNHDRRGILLQQVFKGLKQDFFFTVRGAAAHDDWSMLGQSQTQVLSNSGVGSRTHIELEIAAYANMISRSANFDQPPGIIFRLGEKQINPGQHPREEPPEPSVSGERAVRNAG